MSFKNLRRIQLQDEIEYVQMSFDWNAFRQDLASFLSSAHGFTLARTLLTFLWCLKALTRAINDVSKDNP